MVVREATAADAWAIEAVHCAAFPTSAEARLVTGLEEDGDVLASFVAEIEGATVAHIAFSRMTVFADGNALAAAGLGPLAVMPPYQGLGFGGLLVRTGLEAMAAKGMQICFVLGDPDYYSRFGFRGDLAVPFASPYAGPHLMACLLDSAVCVPERGEAHYAPAFARLE